MAIQPEPSSIPAACATVHEPLGRRELAAPFTVGEVDADILVPGAGSAAALRFDLDDGLWRVTPAAGIAARLNGERLHEPRDLRAGDVIALAQAQVVLRAVSPCVIDVLHLVGNDTIAPLAPASEREGALDDEDVEIGVMVRDVLASAARAPAPPRGRIARRAVIGAVVAVAGAALLLLSSMVRVPLVLDPAEAKVRATDTWLSWHSGATFFVLPGAHRVRASAPGYVALERPVQVVRDATAPVRLRLGKEPGVLVVDTGGVAASVAVDGADIGRVPGEIRVAAGHRTLTLRADRHLDAIVDVQVEGRGQRQDLKVDLKPSWGALALIVGTPGAQVSIDGAAPVPVPARIDLPAGAHRIEISAEKAKPWVSALVVKAGETTAIGPIDLGAPDARLLVRSTPAGSDVSVDGVYRGRTPLDISLSPGGRHDVLVARTGYAPWSRGFGAVSGERTVLEAKLEPVYVALSVSGEPADAEVRVDGVSKGRAPLTLELLAGDHAIEVRQPPLAPYSTTVTLAPGLARSLAYQLTAAGRPSNALAVGTQVTTKNGYVLRLLKPATFEMGSARREQGRRSNETLRRVTLTRAFYMGATEVTNGQFRRFKADHASGYVDKNSVDLDAQPVVQVSWDDAVAYCNWLSAQEGLPQAYDTKDGKWALRTPVANGYRLPSEAEWEYAARADGKGGWRRYAWGDALPMAAASGNFGGIEAQGTLSPILETYRDDWPNVAPVGKFGANPFGLYDLSGNVSEWTHDYYASLPDSAPQTDPFGPPQGTRHAIRGSNWRTATITDLRLAWRDGADGASQTTGFRVARYADP
ncbi:MAG: SUMF1/EgtB/PvdO family nonheme iron enzyme [Steroidobacteraceae bacterium]